MFVNLLGLGSFVPAHSDLQYLSNRMAGWLSTEQNMSLHLSRLQLDLEQRMKEVIHLERTIDSFVRKQKLKSLPDYLPEENLDYR
jgi:hypothetical protein